MSAVAAAQTLKAVLLIEKGQHERQTQQSRAEQSRAEQSRRQTQ
jgi:hypothetical protein